MRVHAHMSGSAYDECVCEHMSDCAIVVCKCTYMCVRRCMLVGANANVTAYVRVGPSYVG